MKQQHFLNLVTAEEAEERFWEAVQPQPLGVELVMLEDAHGRILACDIVARRHLLAVRLRPVQRPTARR